MDSINNNQLIKVSFDIDENNDSEVSQISVNNSIIQFCQKSFKNTINTANELILKQIDFEVGKNDLKSYELAKDLFYKHRNLWIKVKKDTEIIKKEIKPITEKIQFYSDSIYKPLQESGKKLKEKMLIYEEEQERIKQEKKDKEIAQQRREIELSKLLLQFNTEYLTKIQECFTIEDIDFVKNEINNYDINVFEEKVIDATFHIAQLIATADMKRSNIVMKNEQENNLKTEAQKLAEKRQKEDDELKAYEEKINEKLRLEEEERLKKLAILKKIKEEEMELSSVPNFDSELENTNLISDNDLNFDDSFFVSNNQDEKQVLISQNQDLADEMVNSFSIRKSCPHSKIDVEEDEKQTLNDSLTSTPKFNLSNSYNETLKEMFQREIEWFVKKDGLISEEQLAITLAIIVEKNK
jgi:hypothetical protein